MEDVNIDFDGDDNKERPCWCIKEVIHHRTPPQRNTTLLYKKNITLLIYWLLLQSRRPASLWLS